MDEFVLVADPSVCLRLASEAAVIERTAMEWDIQGVVASAIEEYRIAAERLHEAAAACPEGHPDGQLLQEHASEVLVRVQYLESIEDADNLAPIHEHIHPVRLTLGCPEISHNVHERDCGEAAMTAKVIGAAAAVSGATGLLVLGPISGATLGVAAALAATREDQAGLAARKLGAVGIHLCSQAQKINEDHQICRRIASMGGAALQSTWHRLLVLQQQQPAWGRPAP